MLKSHQPAWALSPAEPQEWILPRGSARCEQVGKQGHCPSSPSEGETLTSPWGTAETLFQRGWFRLAERGLQPAGPEDALQLQRRPSAGPFLLPSPWLSSCFPTAQSPPFKHLLKGHHVTILPKLGVQTSSLQSDKP